jgi:hypothetical protein
LKLGRDHWINLLSTVVPVPLIQYFRPMVPG